MKKLILIAFAISLVPLLMPSPAAAQISCHNCTCETSCSQSCTIGFGGEPTTCQEFGGTCVGGSGCVEEECSNTTPTTTINGTSGGDTLTGTSAHEKINGFGGNDTISGNSGDDRIFAGTGADTAYGNSGNDCLFGEGNNDSLTGNTGDDFADGGGGTDTCNAETEINCEI